MATNLIQSAEKIWDEWDLRGAVLVSLLLQTLLIILAASRKRTGKLGLVMLVWFAYLMADWIAVFAIGLITRAQSSESVKIRTHSKVAAFWAPFLLLHLGGPESITAFSVEDNELWIRHLLGLTVDLVLVVYALLLATPNPFWIPSVLVFLAGAVKYVERTVALYLACQDHFIASLEPEQTEEIITSDWKNSNDQEEIEAVKCGYKFFKFFRGVLADSRLGFMVIAGSMDFFSEQSPQFAFKVMEVELNFMYDELFTKMGMLHKARFYYFYRVGCSALIWTAFLLFAFHKNTNIHNIDIVVTYALLVGAIVLDFIGLIKVIFSDWMVATRDSSRDFWLMNAIQKKISFRSRWSGNIYQHNLISYVSKKRFCWLDYIMDKFDLKSTIEELLYLRHRPLPEELKEFIFNCLKKNVKCDSTKRVMGAQRGGATIDYYEAQDRRDHEAQHRCDREAQHRCDLGAVKWSVCEVEYDHSILLWHIATDLLYRQNRVKDQRSNLNKEAKACKILSDYMFYLVVMRPTLMMPSVSSAVFQTRLDQICQQVWDKMKGAVITNEEEVGDELLKSVARLEEEQDERAQFNKEQLLHQAFMLAKKLKSIDEMWETMVKVWLELLCYSARRCRGSAHAQHLTKGGEVITFVALLMHHFGLTETFQSLSEYSDVLA